MENEDVFEVDITKMKYVIGYQLPIHPTEYKVDITTSAGFPVEATIVNTYSVLKEDVCGIPFCCLSPACQKRKTVTDRFIMDGDRLILQSTSAFRGLINCIEKGKVFQILYHKGYVILVNEKEIFILSDRSCKIPLDVKYELSQKIKGCDLAPKKIDLVFL